MIRIFLRGGLVQRVEDIHGNNIDAQVWDSDTEGLAYDDPQLKTDTEGEEYYVYEP